MKCLEEVAVRKSEVIIGTVSARRNQLSAIREVDGGNAVDSGQKPTAKWKNRQRFDFAQGQRALSRPDFSKLYGKSLWHKRV